MMRTSFSIAGYLGVLIACHLPGQASVIGQEGPHGGWRGNSTGVWPAANPPLRWQRRARGAMESMRSATDLPGGEPVDRSPLLEKGQIREWLVLGPFPVEDAMRDFDVDPVGGEEQLRPRVDQRAADRTWRLARVEPDDPMVFGTAELPWLDIAASLGGFQRNQLAYAHAFLYSPRGGRVRVVVDHSWGLKAWVNGRVVFRHPERRAVLGAYSALSRLELEHQTAASSIFDCVLEAGWNRLLVKVSSPGSNRHEQMSFQMRLMDPPDVEYDEENIAWRAELPHRSTSTPILVGDRLFVMSEPDELTCLDKRTGRTLWTALINRYTALSDEERQARPELTQRIDPLIAELLETRTAARREELRAQLESTLVELDRPRFKLPLDGHFAAHFAIVGYTMPTPVSDGRRVYVWSGQGVAACFDLEGRRQWMTVIPANELSYSSTPALADGVFAVFQHRLYGLDAQTGAIRWEQPKVNKNVAGVLSARLSGESVIVTQEGEIVRPRDGHLLYRPKGIVKNDTGWTPGVVLNDVLYLPKYGVKQLSVLDFSGQRGDAWTPRSMTTLETPPELNYRPNREWLDRWTAASPLVAGRYVYMVDMYSHLVVFDLESKRVVHHRKLDLRGFTHYNALAVAASPTLMGDRLLVLDNQGTTLVLTLGPEPQVIERNVIETQLERRIPLPGQELLAYAPPIADGDRLYLRGERFLYCIGRR